MSGCGALRDLPDPRDWAFHRDFHARTGVARVGASAADITQYIDRVRDQGPTETCVGFSFANGIHILAGAQGIQIPHPSELAIYTGAQMRSTPWTVELADIGTFPRDAAAWASEFGVVSEARWPFDLSKVSTRPPLDVYMAGADAHLTGYYRIFGPPSSQVKEALSAGHPVIYCQHVFQNYQDYSGGPYTAPAGDFKGSHAQCLVAFSGDRFRVLNQWGTLWGDAGFADVTDAWLDGPNCFDFWVLTMAPGGVR